MTPEPEQTAGMSGEGTEISRVETERPPADQPLAPLENRNHRSRKHEDDGPVERREGEGAKGALQDGQIHDAKEQRAFP
jgi:hypothetical protein